MAYCNGLGMGLMEHFWTGAPLCMIALSSDYKIFRKQDIREVVANVSSVLAALLRP